jgi:lamin tail-like protein
MIRLIVSAINIKNYPLSIISLSIILLILELIIPTTMPAKSLFCMLALLCACSVSKAQLKESFNDGDITNNPLWIGDTSQWIVNPSFQLQSNDTVKNASFYLSTVNNLSVNTQWELYINLDFNTSSANYADIYLTSSSSDLKDENATGYFVRLGGTNDDICLYRKDSSGIITKLIDGIDKSLNKSNNILKLKVTRDSAYQWILYRDLTGTGTNYFNEGSIVDSVYTTSSYFGIFVKQSTASFFTKHFFDDIVIEPYGIYQQPPYVPQPNDVVINEILFNPKPGGVDYVEIYNRSNNTIGLNQLFIANRNSEDSISSITPLSIVNDSLYPQNFIVITKDPNIVKSQYITLNPDAFVKVNSMPSFNDDSGDVIILNPQGTIIDELKYDANWQFPLISDPTGVSLERINYDAPTQSQSNWHSAATSAGYGTPGYKNSQYMVVDTIPGTITVSPTVFSPDNDGMDDFATIDYSFPKPGYVANITIFDISGRPVRYLVQNELCGTTGTYQWDGLGEKNQQLPIGIYILFTEAFDLEGKTIQFKNTVVLARKH